MTTPPNTPLIADVLGIKGVSDSLCLLTKGVVDNATTVTGAAIKLTEGFITSICKPAADEFGLLLKDHVSHWRATNAIKALAVTQQLLLKQNRATDASVHPRIMCLIIEHASWSETTLLQQMWGGAPCRILFPKGC